jgi:hypothetical protein
MTLTGTATPDASGGIVILANGRAILSLLGQETSSIPIVFLLVADPVGDGFVVSLVR